MHPIDIAEIRAWLHEAGALALSYFNATSGWQKPDQTPVSAADLAVEALLVERLRRRYPEHNIVGEEQTRHQSNSPYLWALDPIDGTGAFLSGLPLWCISLGLLYHNEPVAGAIYFPVTSEYYTTAGDGRAYRDEQLLAVAHLGTQLPEQWLAVPSDAHRRLQITYPGKTRSLGGAAASICYVARGSAVAGIIGPVALWDVAAGFAILAAAGGVATDLHGAPVQATALDPTRTILLGHATVLEQLRPQIARK